MEEQTSAQRSAARAKSPSERGSASRSIPIRKERLELVRNRIPYFHRRTLKIVRGHQRLRFQSAERGDEPVGNDFQSRVVKRGDIIEIAARQRDALLGVDEIPLEVQERCLRLDLRIALLDGYQVLGAGGEIPAFEPGSVAVSWARIWASSV